MKKQFLNLCLPTLKTICCIVFLLMPVHVAQAALSNNYTIVCGQTSGGQPVNCNLSTHRCYICAVVVSSAWVQSTRTEYRCLNKEAETPKNCKVSNTGGVSGNSDVRIMGLKIKGLHKEGQNCVTENFKAMYTSTCYSCEIVETLASAFIKAAAKAYQVSREAGNAILVVGMILWIGLFVLKSFLPPQTDF